MNSIELMTKNEYEEWTASTRDARMAWWREARFGMFVHFGLYSQLGRNEWVQTLENIPVEEYARLADTFNPKPGAPREWAKLAKEAGCRYMVMTTRHHEGFSLWDSKANPFNSVKLGPHRDIVREFVDACREYDLKIGFYSSLMDWHHPDAIAAMYDTAARKRFTDYIEALNTELLTQYGKIDVLWYDVASPMENWEGWDSLERNKRMRLLQPDLIINNRSRLDEDFGTPEGHIRADDRDWEACMTFNDISWGYVDEVQAEPHAYTTPRILKMLCTCSRQGGNLLLNIGPKPDGSVPADAVKPLQGVGEWLKRNGAAAYGKLGRSYGFGGNGVSGVSCAQDGKTVYLWNWIWPSTGSMGFGGYCDAPKRVYTLCDGKDMAFEQKGQRIILHDLPEKSPDPSGVTVIVMEFDKVPEYHPRSYYPQSTRDRDWAKDNKI
ncbi:MAG: alpha-L-fucosidase [Clostridia bacterium]|nr:alpha-L-fucosidase [Clostridia bacterium]